MTSTYTTDLRLTKQGTGDNSGTWGVVANNVFQLIEDSVATQASIGLTGSGNYTLSANNGSTDEARCAGLRLVGTPSANRNVIIPAIQKFYVVECSVSAAYSVIVKSAGGTGVTVVAGDRTFMYCDGLNTYRIQPSLSDLGVTASAGELNILDGLTATVGELNILDGATVTVGELNALDGLTATVAELNVLDGITATVAELNVLDGITATVAELNILDGLTVSTGHLNNTITTAALSAGVGFYTRFRSAELSVATTNVNHGLAAIPYWGVAQFVCKTSTLGYSVGTRLAASDRLGDSTGNMGYQVGFTTTQAFFVLGGATTIRILNKATGANAALDTADWKLVLTVWT